MPEIASTVLTQIAKKAPRGARDRTDGLAARDLTKQGDVLEAPLGLASFRRSRAVAARESRMNLTPRTPAETYWPKAAPTRADRPVRTGFLAAPPGRELTADGEAGVVPVERDRHGGRAGEIVQCRLGGVTGAALAQRGVRHGRERVLRAWAARGPPSALARRRIWRRRRRAAHRLLAVGQGVLNRVFGSFSKTSALPKVQGSSTNDGSIPFFLAVFTNCAASEEKSARNASSSFSSPASGCWTGMTSWPDRRKASPSSRSPPSRRRRAPCQGN